MLYRIFRAFAWVALHAFFRQIEIEGRQNVPTRGPILLVPNHTNALVDPLLIVVALSRRVTITAKNVLAQNPLLGLLMSGLGVVTFHRQEDVDKGAEPHKNVRSLERCRHILAKGGALCIFPEGVSHSDPKMRRFRTGPARIALDFVSWRQVSNLPVNAQVENFPHNRDQESPGPLKIIPVGLLYTQKERFRSQAWLRFGKPVDVADWERGRLARSLAAGTAALPEGQPQVDARQLTDEIRHWVEALTLNYETQEESVLLGWTAEIVATGGTMPRPLGQDEQSAAEWFRLISRLQAGYQALRDSHREEVESLIGQVRRYRSELDRRGIDPAEVYLPIHWGRALLFLVRELELVVIGVPLALFGIVNHILPYQTVKWIARALSKDTDHWASNTIYPGFLIFPLFYVIQIGLAWLLLPAFWAALYTVALPYTGYYALLYRDRIGSTWRRTQTFFHFLRHSAEQAELARDGQEILTRIQNLAEWLPPEAVGTARVPSDNRDNGTRNVPTTSKGTSQ
jgi:1-acyl-sn-glycerol-3-phosphate acyltransferase